MTYINGGENEIGVAFSDSWAAAWTVDSPYIEIMTREFWDLHETKIRAEFAAGRTFSDASGSIHSLGTAGDLNDDGFPKGHDGDPNEYVAAELNAWIAESGDDYEQAMADGYGR